MSGGEGRVWQAGVMEPPPETLSQGFVEPPATIVAANDKATMRTLMRWHTWAFVFMLVNTLIVGLTTLTVTVPQTVGYPDRSDNDEGGAIASEDVRVVYNLRVKILIALFTGLASFDHLVVACLISYCPAYMFDLFLVKKANPFRWLEYSVSASIMTVLVATLCGVYDLHLLFALGGLTAICMLIGATIELMPQKDGPFRATCERLFWIATVCVALPGAEALSYFARASPPDFVYAAFIGLGVCYTAFAVNFWLQYKGKYGFVRAEINYVLLSFTAKTFLAYDVLYGFKAQSDR